MVNWYLFAAYSFVWTIFVGYVWVLSKREAQLRKELTDLRKRLGENSPAGSRPSQS